MKVQIISFHCVLKNKFGKVLSSTFNHDVLTGSDSNKQELVALSTALQNLKKGEKRNISLTASEAYGFYDPKMVVTMPRQSLPQLQKTEAGLKPVVLAVDGKPHVFRVVNMNAEDVTLDGNHPLAGQDLVFEIETTAVRDATAEEISEAAIDESKAMYH